MPPLLPLERLDAAMEALLERVGGVGDLVAEFPRHVLENEVDRVHLQIGSDLVHHRLDAEVALRIFGAAEISGYRFVGVHGMDDRLDVLALIDFDAADRARVLPIRAHAAVPAQLDRLEHAVGADAHLVVLRRGPAPVHADEVVFPREFQLHGRAGFPGEQGGHEVVILILVLVAESTAHVLTDDAHLVGGNSEMPRHVGPAVRDALGRGIQRELVAVPGGDCHARLHLRVVDVGGREAILEDVIGGTQSFLDVPAPIDLRLRFVLRVE